MEILFISLSEAAQVLGIAGKTARNWVSAGKFPLPTHRVGGKRLVLVKDIQSFVESLCGSALPLVFEELPHKPKRAGRPRKK